MDDSQRVYTVVGMSYGSFVDKEDGRGVRYANIQVTSPFEEARPGRDFHAQGAKCESKKCVSPEVFADVEVGDTVQLFFNDKDKVSLIVSAPAT